MTDNINVVPETAADESADSSNFIGYIDQLEDLVVQAKGSPFSYLLNRTRGSARSGCQSAGESA